MPDSELKNCPCCGKKAQLSSKENNTGEDKFSVFCTNWKCIVSTKPCDTSKEAITIWNARPSDESKKFLSNAEKRRHEMQNKLVDESKCEHCDNEGGRSFELNTGIAHPGECGNCGRAASQEHCDELNKGLMKLSSTTSEVEKMSAHKLSFEITKIFEELRVMHDVPEPVLESLEKLIRLHPERKPLDEKEVMKVIEKVKLHSVFNIYQYGLDICTAICQTFSAPTVEVSEEFVSTLRSILDWHKENKQKLEQFTLSTPYGDYSESEIKLIAIFTRLNNGGAKAIKQEIEK